MSEGFNLIDYALSCIITTVIGIGALAATWKMFDNWLLKDWSLSNAFHKDHITNGGIFIAALIVGVCFLVAYAAT